MGKVSFKKVLRKNELIQDNTIVTGISGGRPASDITFETPGAFEAWPIAEMKQVKSQAYYIPFNSREQSRGH